MEDQVPFKVYTFWDPDSKPEVRRFGVEKSVVTSFHYLTAKLQDVFPGLRNRSYSIAWKDEDSDDVIISSDEEVMTALTALSGGLIKLFVYCKDDKNKDDACEIVITASTIPEPTNSCGKAAHLNVQCDVCNSAVVGFRYKCAICPDYDLCARCESAGNHKDHCMLRLPTPEFSRTLMKVAIKRSRQFLKSVASTVEECPYKKHKRERSGERKHRDSDHHGHRSDHHGHRGDHHRCEHRRQRSSWFDTFAAYMNEFANLAGDVGVDTETRGPPMAQENQPEEQAKKAENTQVPKQPEQSTSENTAQPHCPVFPGNFNAESIQKLIENFLGGAGTAASHLGETSMSNEPFVAGALNVEAIEKLISMYLGGNTSATQHKNSSAPPEQAAPATKDAEMGQGDMHTTDNENTSVRSETSYDTINSEKDASPDRAEDWTVINNDKDLMDACMTPTRPEESAPPPVGFNLPEEFQERVKITDGQTFYPPLNVSTAVMNPKEAQQAKVDQQKAALPKPQPAAQPQPGPPPQVTAQSQPAGRHQQGAQSQPSAPQPQSYAQFRYHAKPHIDAAIQHMLSMGFTNEGGWLTQLLDNTEGNISAVLDLLTPVNPKNK